MRNRSTGDVYLAVVFTIYRQEDVNEDGTLKPAALRSNPAYVHSEQDEGEHEAHDEKKVLEEARRKLSEAGLVDDVVPETSPDDVD